MSFEPLTVWVSGVPKGQPRGRAFVTGGKSQPRARIWTPGTAEAWKGAIALAFKPHAPTEPISDPCEILIDLFFKRPGRLMRKKDPAHPLPCPALPDWDNAGKAICDALEQINVLANDKLICIGTVRSWYSAFTWRSGGMSGAGKTGAAITIRPVFDTAWDGHFYAWPPPREHLIYATEHIED